MDIETVCRSLVTLKTGLIALDPIKLMRLIENASDYSNNHEHSNYPGKILIRGELWMGSTGLEGHFALFVPPPKHKIDVPSNFIKNGDWEWWHFLSCISVPRNDYKIAVILSFAHESFFNRSFDIVCCLEHDQLGEESEIISPNYPSQNCVSEVTNAWSALWRVFQREFDATEASHHDHYLLYPWP